MGEVEEVGGGNTEMTLDQEDADMFQGQQGQQGEQQQEGQLGESGAGEMDMVSFFENCDLDLLSSIVGSTTNDVASSSSDAAPASQEAAALTPEQVQGVLDGAISRMMRTIEQLSNRPINSVNNRNTGWSTGQAAAIRKVVEAGCSRCHTFLLPGASSLSSPTTLSSEELLTIIWTQYIALHQEVNTFIETRVKHLTRAY